MSVSLCRGWFVALVQIARGDLESLCCRQVLTNPDWPGDIVPGVIWQPALRFCVSAS